jgi:hypothetical protein
LTCRHGGPSLDFVDAKTKQLIWRGVASGALSDKPDPSQADEKIDGVVQQMLGLPRGEVLFSEKYFSDLLPFSFEPSF